MFLNRVNRLHRSAWPPFGPARSSSLKRFELKTKRGSLISDGRRLFGPDNKTSSFSIPLNVYITLLDYTYYHLFSFSLIHHVHLVKGVFLQDASYWLPPPSCG